ncbi:MAG: tetratricopeptide repeat protein [Xanthobacteraceae bacterium]
MASKRRMLSPNPATSAFGRLLDQRLDDGTRPSGAPDSKGVPWPNKEFANAVGKHSTEGPKSERTIRNWRNGETLPSPADLEGILQALFGGKPAYVDARAELTEAYHRTRDEDDGKLDSKTPQASASSLPTKPLRCLGRDDDLRSVLEALIAARDNTAVLVLGGPGMGKTTVTRQAAVDAAVIDKFGQRRWFVELETATNAEALEKAIIVALGLDPASARFDAALARLAQAPGLLVLDNLETPWDGEREKVEELLAALHRVPGLVLLASIRGNDSPAGVRWTRRRTMHPLEPPHDRALFLDIAADIKPDDPNLNPLLTLLGGVPIAIELVGLLAAPHDSLRAIHEEWKRAGVALAKRRGVEPSRLSSLEVSLELSFQSARLGDAGRRLFGILGQLPAGIAAEDLDSLLETSAFDARQGMLASGLGFERDGRLDLLPPIRDHARRLHSPENEAISWWGHFLSLATRSRASMRTEGGFVIHRLSAELPNIHASIRAAIATSSLESALAALPVITFTMCSTGFGTSAAIHELATAFRSVDNSESEADCLWSLGDIALARSNHQIARDAYERALSVYEQIGDLSGKAICTARLGEIALRRSDHDSARGAYEQAVPLFREIGDRLGEANCILSLGEISLSRSDHETARKAFEKSLTLYREIGDVLGEANSVQRLGDIAFRRSDHDAARKAYEQALPLHRQVGDFRGETNCIQRLGDIALSRSDHQVAQKAFEQALPRYRQVGDITGTANCIKSLGDIAYERSDYKAAGNAYREALPLHQRAGDILGEANCIRSLGNIAFRNADSKAAQEGFEKALSLYRQFGDILGEANCIKSVGDIKLAYSDPGEASKAYEQALPLYRQVGDILGEASCMRGLGHIALVRGDREAARNAYLDALALLERIHDPYSIGFTHLALSKAIKGTEREKHRVAARQVWLSIGREDLVKKHGLSE